MIFQRIRYILQAIGVNGITRAIKYAFYRDRVDRKFTHLNSGTKTLTPGKLVRTAAIQGGIHLEYENARVELFFISINTVRISWEPGQEPKPYTIVKRNKEVPQPSIKHNSSHSKLTLGSFDISIDYSGSIVYQDITGNTFRKDDPPQRYGSEWTLSTILSPEEHIYGLGERANPINLRPGCYQSWNNEPGGSYSTGKDPLYIGTPICLFISKNGYYLAYFENSYRSEYNITNTFQANFSGGMLRYYIIFGSLETIYKELAELTGYPFMPPRWVFGYHQSRWGYKNEADIKNVINGFKHHNLPLSAIHLDIDYMDGFKLFTVNKKNFPALNQLTKEMDENGIKIVASVNPAIKIDRKYELYVDGLSKDVFCKLQNGEILTGFSWPGWSVFPDFTSVEARKWWQGQYHTLVNEGIAGIWHDMNEPALFAAWGDKTFPLATSHNMDDRRGTHLEGHNLYSLLMNQACYEGMKVCTPQKRPWILSRSGWAGSQRYAWIWTGDIESTWEALRQTIPTILGLGLSGHAFSGVDVGGFSGNPDKELYLRWFQLATFLPFFRTHSAIGTKAREPWKFGEPTTNIIRDFLEIRYRLVPYLYTSAWETVQTGLPFIRPIFWNDPQNEDLWDIDDEFLLGNSLLIAPILQENTFNRLVTLPTGNWYSFWDDQLYSGSKNDIRGNLETIPVFVKAGSLLPIEENGDLYLHLYPGDEGISTDYIYLDSGDGYGDWRLDIFHMKKSRKAIEISWDKEGKYDFPYRSVIIKVHGKNLVNATISDKNLEISENTIEPSIFQTLNLVLTDH